MSRSPTQQHKVGECEVDEAMQGLPLVVGGEQGWHSGRAPLTLGSAQRCSVRLTSARFSPNQSPTSPVNSTRCCCPLTCSPCLLPRRHLHRLHHRHPPLSANKEKIYMFSTINFHFLSLSLAKRDATHIVVVVLILTG